MIVFRCKNLLKMWQHITFMVNNEARTLHKNFSTKRENITTWWLHTYILDGNFKPETFRNE